MNKFPRKDKSYVKRKVEMSKVVEDPVSSEKHSLRPSKVGVVAISPVVEDSLGIGKNLPGSVQPMEINVQGIEGF